MALPFYLIFFLTATIAAIHIGFDEIKNLLDKDFDEASLQSLANKVTPDNDEAFTVELPYPFRWNRVGSRSVELGWNAKDLANLTADRIKLTAYLYEESVKYKYTAVPIEREKLTVNELKPSTFYEMLLQALKNDKAVYNHTSYLKTPAKGDGADSIGLSLVLLISGLLLQAWW